MIEGPFSAEFAAAGYAVIAGVLTSDEMRGVTRNLAESAMQAVGSRTLLDTRWCQALAGRLACEPRLSAVMPTAGRAVQCTLFEKSFDKNWLVGRVVPGSHRLGRLIPAQASLVREIRGDCPVPVAAGGVMLMRPLLLHASSKASIDSPRRVLHFVFGPPTLAEGLNWPRV